MKINKTNVMVFLPIFINGQQLETFDRYKSFGAWINLPIDPVDEIRCRIEMSRNAFTKMKNIFCNMSAISGQYFCMESKHGPFKSRESTSWKHSRLGS